MECRPSARDPDLFLQVRGLICVYKTQWLIGDSFIFIAQRELTVSVAFTAISLFSMVRMPLNVIPTFVRPQHLSSQD
jgi:hypothetical protein